MAAKKQALSLAASLLVVTLLIGLLIFLLIESRTQNPPPTPSAPSQESHSPLLPSLTSSDFNTITVSNTTGTFTLVNQGNAYRLLDLDDIKINAAATDSLIAVLLSLHPPSAASPPSYQIERPLSYKIQFATIDAQTHTLTLTGKAASEPTAQLDGQLVSLTPEEVSILGRSKLAYIERTITPSSPGQYDQGTIVLSGSVRPAPLTIEVKAKATPPPTDTESPAHPKEYTYDLTTPIQRTLSQSAADRLLSHLFSLQATSVAAVNPTPTEMALFELGAPFSVINAAFDGDSFLVKASSPDENGFVRLMRDGYPVIFTAPAEQISWLTLQYEALIDALYTPASVRDVSQMVVSSPTEVYDFVLIHPSAGEMKISCNGKALDAPTFTQLFQTITPIPPLASTDGKPTDTPALTMTISYQKPDRDPDTIQLTPAGDGTLYLTVNGETAYIARESLVETILQNCRNVLTGGELTKL